MQLLFFICILQIDSINNMCLTLLKEKEKQKLKKRKSLLTRSTDGIELRKAHI